MLYFIIVQYKTKAENSSLPFAALFIIHDFTVIVVLTFLLYKLCRNV